MYIQIVGGRIYTPSGWIDGGSVLVEGKKIKAVLNTDLPIEGARTIDGSRGGLHGRHSRSLPHRL